MSTREAPAPAERLVVPTPSTVAAVAADRIVSWAREAIEARGRFDLVLAGGSTPRPTYERLAERHADALDWSRVRIFLGDERRVPLVDARSNFAMAREALLTHVPIDWRHVYPMPTGHETPAACAAAYEHLLRTVYGSGAEVGVGAAGRATFDLVLLGLGEDGHTVSLFPGDEVADEVADEVDDAGERVGRWVRAARAPASADVRERITLTHDAIARARRVMFLVTGESKRDPLHTAVRDGTLPAGRVSALEGVTWLVDRAAWGGGPRERRDRGPSVGG